MDTFHAMFWDAKVFVNKRYHYLNNEILVRYLNMDTGMMENLYNELHDCERGITLRMDMIMEFAERQYNERVQKTQQILTKIDNLGLEMPPYKEYLAGKQAYEPRLIACLNRYPHLFENGVEYGPYATRTVYPEHNSYGYLTTDDCDGEKFWLTRFDPSKMLERLEESGNEEDGSIFIQIKQANEDIKSTISPYLCWLEDVMRAQNVYAKLLDKYIHIRHGFLKEYELAEQLERYLKTESLVGRSYLRLAPVRPQAVTHEVFRPQEGAPILCDSYDFDSIGAFLYTDFFRGLRNNFLPKRCGNCGKWFLLTHGKYSDYCERPLDEDDSKTCRSASSRKKYDDKCRTDPVWQAYNRAYKAHYARYMKKKMTNAEFEKWGVYAIKLREKAIAGEMEFIEYERLLKV
ncbi:DUF6076 domain-containing protein [Eubacteriales bacterium OttesenSCG-928-K08]|nr:DUF6076 domain-containing protein [Eubacteriales bacterium OttesenSCG-928-K08]